LSSQLEKLPRNIAANAELANQAGRQSGGTIDPLGFVVLGTVLMALITPPALTQAFAMGAGGGGGTGGAAADAGDGGYDGRDPYSGFRFIHLLPEPVGYESDTCQVSQRGFLCPIPLIIVI
jgi:hypothetical protein